MGAVPNWLSLALLGAVYAGAVLALYALARKARRHAGAARVGVARLLANPEELQRVWYVQRAAPSHPHLILRGRDIHGNVVTLAVAHEAPQVWHQLQVAGVLVHPEP